MRSVSPALIGAAVLMLFAAAFGATWMLTMRGTDRPAAQPASAQEQLGADQTVTPPPAAEPLPMDAEDVDLGAAESVDTAEADRQALALDRAQATAGTATPEADPAPARRSEDRAASAKGLAIGERIGSHTAPRFRGDGSFRSVSTDRGTVGRGGRVVTYSIEIENGLAIGDNAFVTEVSKILSDQRSWIGSGRVQLRQVASPSSAQYSIRLASPNAVDRACAQGGMDTEGIYSCRSGRNVMINYYRWMAGAYEYPNALSSYRIYLVNHEFGHAIGHGHRDCTGAGSPAPVMLQQSISSRGCASQPWPLQSELAQQG